jgi:iron complex outermembrane receptor protein
MGSLKRALLLGLAVGVGATGSVAFAQDAADDTIIVTARKRAETLQEVPLAVTAITGEEIARQGLEDSTDLVARVPSLYIATGSINFPTTSHLQLTMRGVGFNAGLEPAFGVFVDGMYEPHIAYDTAFLDAERVEVLRGPQGTLFGRNTQAGALNIVTRKPDENFRGNVRGEYADFNSIRLSGALSGPIGENVFASLSAQYASTDGYIYNVTLDRDQMPSELLVARGVLRWTPTENLDISLTADASQRDYNEMGRGVPISTGDRYESIADEEENELNKTTGLQLNVDYRISPNITLTSISGIRRASTDTWVDADGTPTNQAIWIQAANPPFTPNPVAVHGATLNVRIDQEFRSQELRLAGEWDRVDWLAGIYYFDRTTDDDDTERFLGVGVAPPTSALGVYFEQDFFEKRDGWAGFGQISFRPTERLELTVGGRYSEETVETGGVRVFYRSNGTSNPPVFKDFEQTYTNFSAMGSVSFDVTDDINAYFTYAEGWKAGGVNRAPANAAQVLPFDDEFSTTYELGLKSSFAENRVILNAALFYIELQDQQLSGFVPVPGSTPVLVVSNAGASSVEGVEVEFLARPTDNFEFSAAIGYADTELEDYVRVFSATNQFDMRGLNFEDVPELTGSAQFVYTTGPAVLFDGGLEFRLMYRYIDEVTTQDQGVGTTATSQLTIPSYDRWDGRVSLVRDDGWRFTVFVDNILDSFDYVRRTTPAWTPNIPFGDLVQPLEPRQVGFAVAKSF